MSVIINGSTGITLPPATSASDAVRWDTPDMASLTITQVGGALTFAGTAHSLTFRSATLTNGVVSTIIADPADLVLPSGGTLGFVTTVQGTILVAEMNNGGVSEYAICNQAGGLQTDERNLISTTAIGAGSTAANVWYSTTARTSLPYKIIGAVDVVNTAGAWGDPVLVQAAGGNALTAMGSLGYGQTWQVVTGSRAAGTTYYNTTGKPIFARISVVGTVTGAGMSITPVVNGVTLAINQTYCPNTGGYYVTEWFIIPISASYSISITGGNLSSWGELR